MDSNKDIYANWNKLWGTLSKRTYEPCFHPSFVLYFIVSVVLVGGAGVWLELHKYLLPSAGTTPSLESLRTAVITFFPALAGSACVQVILAESDDRAMRAIAVCILTVLSVTALAIAPATVSDCAALTLGALGSTLALFSWWVANGTQPDYQDGNPHAATGSRDPNAKLAGSLDGFTA